VAAQDRLLFLGPELKKKKSKVYKERNLVKLTKSGGKRREKHFLYSHERNGSRETSETLFLVLI
jgi:hypothetical protein